MHTHMHVYGAQLPEHGALDGNFRTNIYKYAILQFINPLGRRLSDHALTAHTYLGVEAIDPYITIQVNGPHTIFHCYMGNSLIITNNKI